MVSHAFMCMVFKHGDLDTILYMSEVSSSTYSIIVSPTSLTWTLKWNLDVNVIGCWRCKIVVTGNN